ncbi:hypothetical protein JCM8097_008702 [Rhodosporidiobolus ruineniae]
MPVPRLPPEIVSLVLDFLFGNLNQSERVKHVAPLSLVVREWSELVPAAAWKKLELDISASSPSSLLELVCLRAERIAPHVRQLRISGSEPGAIEPSSAVWTRILGNAAFDKLDTLDIDINSAVDQRPSFEAFRVLAVRVTLRNLTLISDWSGNELVQALEGLVDCAALSHLILGAFGNVDVSDERWRQGWTGGRLSRLHRFYFASPSLLPRFLDAITHLIEPSASFVSLMTPVDAAFSGWVFAYPRRTLAIAAVSPSVILHDYLQHLQQPSSYVAFLHVRLNPYFAMPPPLYRLSALLESLGHNFHKLHIQGISFFGALSSLCIGKSALDVMSTRGVRRNTVICEVDGGFELFVRWETEDGSWTGWHVVVDDEKPVKGGREVGVLKE